MLNQDNGSLSPSQSFESDAKSMESQISNCFKDYKERLQLQKCIILAAVQRVKANQGRSQPKVLSNQGRASFKHQGLHNGRTLSDNIDDKKKKTLNEGERLQLSNHQEISQLHKETLKKDAQGSLASD